MRLAHCRWRCLATLRNLRRWRAKRRVKKRHHPREPLRASSDRLRHNHRLSWHCCIHRRRQMSSRRYRRGSSRVHPQWRSSWRPVRGLVGAGGEEGALVREHAVQRWRRGQQALDGGNADGGQPAGQGAIGSVSWRRPAAHCGDERTAAGRGRQGSVLQVRRIWRNVGATRRRQCAIIGRQHQRGPIAHRQLSRSAGLRRL